MENTNEKESSHENAIECIIRLYGLKKFHELEEFCKEVELAFSTLFQKNITENLYYTYINDIKKDVNYLNSIKHDQTSSDMDVDVDVDVEMDSVMAQLINESQEQKSMAKAMNNYRNPVKSLDFYSIFLIILMINDKVGSARFLYKRLAQEDNNNNNIHHHPFIQFLRNLIGLAMNNNDTRQVIKMLSEFNMEEFQKIIQISMDIDNNNTNTNEAIKEEEDEEDEDEDDDDEENEENDKKNNKTGVENENENKNTNETKSTTTTTTTTKNENDNENANEIKDEKMKIKEKEEKGKENESENDEDNDANKNENKSKDEKMNKKNKFEKEEKKKSHHNHSSNSNSDVIHYEMIKYPKLIGELLKCLISKVRERQILLICKAYDHIKIEMAAQYLGLSETEVIQCLINEKGWRLEGYQGNGNYKNCYIIPKPVVEEKKQKTTMEQVNQLTNHLIYLEESDEKSKFL